LSWSKRRKPNLRKAQTTVILMIPDDIDRTIQELVEDLEEEVQTKVDVFWAELESQNLTEEEHNEVTKKLLNVAEYLFTYNGPPSPY
jgi:hypothetical protein